jgi:ring-1,2-phenylacetyl-CoA epoxidase subunit PaaA
MTDNVIALPNEEQFQARIDAEEKIEPKDWMPERYRQNLIRQISPACAFRGNWRTARG